VPEASRATGRHPAPQGTDRTGGWGRAAGAAGGGWIDLIFSNHQKLRLENQDAEKFMHFLEGNSTKLL
jgi:hypothetical protein